MIIEAYSNGQRLRLGDEFIHDRRKWVITNFELDKKDNLKKFQAIDEGMSELGDFVSYDDKIIHLTGKNYKDIYNLKKDLSE